MRSRSRSPTTARGSIRAATGQGTGLQGIADRLGALDGELEVTSRPGVGTTVTGRVPVDGRTSRRGGRLNTRSASEGRRASGGSSDGWSGSAFAIMAFVLEKVVMRSVRKKGSAEEGEEVTTMISKGGEVDVDL